MAQTQKIRHSSRIELRLGNLPLLGDLAKLQPYQFHRRLVAREMTAAPHGAAQLCVYALYGIGGIIFLTSRSYAKEG